MTDTATCPCATCDELRREARFAADQSFTAYITRFMILCPTCGNKRCPHATHHANACTGSNEYGQAGSNYGGRTAP